MLNSKRKAVLVDEKYPKKPKIEGDRRFSTRTAKGDVPPQQGPGGALVGTSSRESHAKQKQLVQERKAAKPNADQIARSKKLWERLRRKSHVPKAERDQLVQELLEIIDGRVKDYVFKHDSVRVIQCALKYATPAQRTKISLELEGSYRELAESKYAKFLTAKMVTGDDKIRDRVISEFYGHVKRLIRHPEASWIVDDIYRGIATKEQKALLLREWYGPEFFVFRKTLLGHTEGDEKPTADLAQIIERNPEKRGPVMQHLKEMTNQLVQKKTTGFTMLHDALLQYFLNCKPGSPEATEFLEMLRDDEEGDCYKNLAFTKSGSRLVCLALAYGSSKDRRTILKYFRTHIKLLASDSYGHLVLLTAYEVVDDTVMSTKSIFPELLSKDLEPTVRDQELQSQVEHLTARIPLLYLMNPEPPKWLLTEDDTSILKEVREIRQTTSKKDPETRRVELVKAISQPLLDTVATQAQNLAFSSFGCQFVTETLLGSIGNKEPALKAIAELVDLDGTESADIINTPHVGRMLKTLVQGGRFDPSTRSIIPVQPTLEFHDLLFKHIMTKGEQQLIALATGSNSFVILAMLEASNFSHHDELKSSLRNNRTALKADNPGTKILIEKLNLNDVESHQHQKKKDKPRKPIGK